MEPSGDQPHNLDPSAGEPPDIGLDGFVPDIGVDGAPSRSRRTTRRTAQASRQHSPAAGSERNGPKPMLVVAAIVGLVAVASLVFALVGGRDQSDGANPILDPVPSVAPDPDASIADLLAPEPTTVIVPIVNEEFTRAGNQCRVGLDQDLANSAVFTVPSGRSMSRCNLLASGVNARLPEDSLAQLWFVDQPLGHQLNALGTGDGINIDTGAWAPVDGRRGYRFELLVTSRTNEWDQLQLVEVPGGTIHVLRRHDENEESAARLAESFDELVASITVDGRDESPAELPTTGGWCSGDHYVTRVPDDWFAEDSCRWLNSSSESPIVLQCECLPPLWIEHVSLPLDGDYGILEPSVDRLIQREDGSVIRLIEGLRRDPNNMDRPVRVVVVDGGVERIAVIAAEFPEHVLPGHTWQDTLTAQQSLVDNLRFHSLPECGTGSRWIAASEAGQIPLLVGGDGVSVPSGSAVRTTGCRRTIGQIEQVEVRLEADPTVIGWVDPAVLTEPQVEACSSDADAEIDPGEWDQRVDGDFDGDGRDDALYVRDLPGADSETEVADNIRVVFASGGTGGGLYARRSVEGTFPFPFIEPAGARRFVGMGRDLLEVVTRDASRAGDTQLVSLFDLSSCSLDHDFGWLVVDGRDERSGFCHTIDGETTVVRGWRSFQDRYQGWVLSTDQVWSAVDGRLTISDGTNDGVAGCGPDLDELVDQIVVEDPDAQQGTALTGDHQLTLQWISAREESVGTIEFDPLGNDRYEVDGRHRGESGNELRVVGMVEQISDSELVFTGRITSTVAWLNGGEPCVRDTGQRFIARPGTSFWRLQDRINCDGGRTDWIDIEFSTQPD